MLLRRHFSRQHDCLAEVIRRECQTSTLDLQPAEYRHIRTQSPRIHTLQHMTLYQHPPLRSILIVPAHPPLPPRRYRPPRPPARIRRDHLPSFRAITRRRDLHRYSEQMEQSVCGLLRQITPSQCPICRLRMEEARWTISRGFRCMGNRQI